MVEKYGVSTFTTFVYSLQYYKSLLLELYCLILFNIIFIKFEYFISKCTVQYTCTTIDTSQTTLHRIIHENLFEKKKRQNDLMLQIIFRMAQIQLSDPTPLEETSLSDQTSQMEETRPPDPSLSPVSVTPDSPAHSVSALDPSLSLSHEHPSISLSPPRATGCLFDKIILSTLSIVYLRPLYRPPSVGS